MSVTKIYIAKRKINGHDENGKPKTYMPEDPILHAESWGGPFRSMKSMGWLVEKWISNEDLQLILGENKIITCENCEKEFKTARGLATHQGKCKSLVDQETEDEDAEEEYEEIEVEVEVDEDGNEIEETQEPEPKQPEFTL